MEATMIEWIGSVFEFARRTPVLALGIFGVWFLIPFLTQMVIHPDDVIRLQHVMQGIGLPAAFGAQQLTFGAISAVATIVVGGLLLLGLLTVLYHRLGFALALWPVATIAFGLVGNLVWGYKFGFIDQQGIAAGFVPAVLTLIWQRIAEGWAQDFVFGRGERPSR
jgi:hypothetical protein